MPYKSGLIQAAISAIGAVAFLIANLTSSSGDPRQKRVTGIVQKSGNDSIIVTEQNSRQHTIRLDDRTTIFLNERTIPFKTIENGRKATVVFQKTKGQLLAMNIDLFPNHSDFEPPEEISVV